MAESTKVRLVRCPKCENLLPELADYSVYRCGGCGAVLRAKNNNCERQNSSEKSDEERTAEVVTQMPNSLEKGIVNASDISDMDLKSNASSLRCDEKNVEKADISSTDGCKNQSKLTSGKWVDKNDLDMDLNRDDVNNVVGSENTYLDSLTGCTRGSLISGGMSSCQKADKGEMNAFPSFTINRGENARFSTSNLPDEGPSNYNSDSRFNNGVPLRNHDDQDGANRVHYLEKDRAELLRKLDELKEQINRSCPVADKPKENFPLNGRTAPPDPCSVSDTWFPGGPSASDRTSMQFFVPDKQAGGPYFNHPTELFPYSCRPEMGIHGFHPSKHKSNNVSGYRDAYGSQMLGRAPSYFHGQYEQHSRHYFSGHCMDTNSDLFQPYPSNAATFHQPSCSSCYCYEKHHGVSVSVPPAAYRRFPDVSNNPVMYHNEHPADFGSHVHNSSGIVPPPLNFHGTQSHTRLPSDLSPQMDGFIGFRPRRMFVANGARFCRPIAGGAPFLTCFNCFELLQLPKNVLLMPKNQQMIRCGSCSTVINVDVVNKKIVLSIKAEATQIPARVDDSSNEMMKEITSYSHGHMNQINVNFSSDDLDGSGYDFQTVETDPNESLTGHFLNSMNLQEMQSFHSSSPSTFEDEIVPDVLIAQREVIDSVHQPIKPTTLSPPPPASPLQQHFDCSSTNYVENRFGKGNRSSRSDQENMITNKAATRQNSMKEASMVTEMEVSYHEYAHTGASQDSGDTNREENQSKGNKGGDSFFANIKKSFKDFSRINQVDDRGRVNVSVNGHLIPARVVKKAEKLAGPISPGQYWYDFRAGFWGVMGGPCLGIIPPFVEEFNHAMPENCSGGNTGIFVNGRELHQKDLDLLASRGLPTDRDRSYIIEISGRVLDEDSGEELYRLGKLAPTVERVKHGFGMQGPKAV